jgi:hypothetical protein
VERWPPLPWDDWKDTCTTLHMWTQIVGKVKLELAPFLNELWEVGFHVTARGLTTGLIPVAARAFEVQFDFIDHQLVVEATDGEVTVMPLVARTVAEFYGDFMDGLRSLGIDVAIDTTPSEVPDPIPFERDTVHSSYDPEPVSRWWRILVGTAMVLQGYRSTFAGKSSPILFYWGGFDLAEARYSGRPAPVLENVPSFYRIAEDEENISCGFWPGNPTLSGVTFGEPAFYAYTNPAPAGLEGASVEPRDAYYDTRLGEFILRYEDARRAESPERAILAFFRSAYDAGATLAGWNRAFLDRPPPRVGHRGR